MQRKLIYLYLFCLLTLLPLVQAAQPAAGSQLEQYQKVVEDTRGYRSFGYEAGCPEGINTVLKDDLGYMWMCSTYSPISVYRFNGYSFKNMLLNFPAVERDSLTDVLQIFSPDTKNTISDIVVVGKHYFYQWQDTKFKRYEFPKDDVIREKYVLNNKLVCIGNKGYTVWTATAYKYYNSVIPTERGFDRVEYINSGVTISNLQSSRVIDEYNALYSCFTPIQANGDGIQNYKWDKDQYIYRYHGGVRDSIFVAKQDDLNQYDNNQAGVYFDLFQCADEKPNINTKEQDSREASNIDLSADENMFWLCGYNTNLLFQIDTKTQKLIPHHLPQGMYIIGMYKDNFSGGRIVYRDNKTLFDSSLSTPKGDPQIGDYPATYYYLLSPEVVNKNTAITIMHPYGSTVVATKCYFQDAWNQKPLILQDAGCSLLSAFGSEEMQKNYFNSGNFSLPQSEKWMTYFSYPHPQLTGVTRIVMVDNITRSQYNLDIAESFDNLSYLYYDTFTKSLFLSGSEGIIRVPLQKEWGVQRKLNQATTSEEGYFFQSKGLWELCELRSAGKWRLSRLSLYNHNPKTVNPKVEFSDIESYYVDEENGLLYMIKAQESSKMEVILKHSSYESYEVTSPKLTNRILTCYNLNNSQLVTIRPIDDICKVEYFDHKVLIMSPTSCVAVTYTDSKFGIITYLPVGGILNMVKDLPHSEQIDYWELFRNLEMEPLGGNKVFVPGQSFELMPNHQVRRCKSNYDKSQLTLSQVNSRFQITDDATPILKIPSCVISLYTGNISIFQSWLAVYNRDDRFYVQHLVSGNNANNVRISQYIDDQLVTRYDDFICPLNKNVIPEIFLYSDVTSIYPVIGDDLYYFYTLGHNNERTEDQTPVTENATIGWKKVSLKIAHQSKNTLQQVVSTNRRKIVWFVYSTCLVKLNTDTGVRFTYSLKDGLPKEINTLILGQTGDLQIIGDNAIYVNQEIDKSTRIDIPWLGVNSAIVPIKYTVQTDFLRTQSKVVKLKHLQNNIRIPVNLMETVFPERCLLEYRLVGLNNRWQRRPYSEFIEYNQLNPGKYSFQVRAYADVTPSQTHTINFHIRPPWYNTWWAYLLYVLITAALINAIYRWRTRQLLQRNLTLENTVKERTAELEDRQKRIQDAIEYASVIQSSILPQRVDMQAAFADYFAIWKPRDVVGGDFYWHYTDPVSQEILVGVIDCTGHSVPGALLSMTVNSIMKSIVIDRQIDSPHEILHELHREIGSTLHQEREFTSQDGMELGLLRINRQLRQLSFSGAGLNLLSFDPAKGAVEVIRGNRHGIGGLKWHKELIFDEVVLSYNPNTRFYIYSDGIIDQPNPAKDKNRRLGNADWIDVIGSIAALELSEQEAYLLDFIDQLLEFHEQRDDITLLCLVPDKA